MRNFICFRCQWGCFRLDRSVTRSLVSLEDPVWRIIQTAPQSSAAATSTARLFGEPRPDIILFPFKAMMTMMMTMMMMTTTMAMAMMNGGDDDDGDGDDDDE